MSGIDNPYESRPNVPESYYCSPSTPLQYSSSSDGGERRSGSEDSTTFGLVRLDISQRENPLNNYPANNPVINYPANNPVINYPANNPVINYPANNPVNPSEDEAIELPGHLTDVGGETHAGPPAPFVTAARQVMESAVNRSTSTTRGVAVPPILDMINPITLAASRQAAQKQLTITTSHARQAEDTFIRAGEERTLSSTAKPWYDNGSDPMDMRPSFEELDVLIARYPDLRHRRSEFARLTRRQIKTMRDTEAAAARLRFLEDPLYWLPAPNVPGKPSSEPQSEDEEEAAEAAEIGVSIEQYRSIMRNFMVRQERTGDTASGPRKTSGATTTPATPRVPASPARGEHASPAISVVDALSPVQLISLFTDAISKVAGHAARSGPTVPPVLAMTWTLSPRDYRTFTKGNEYSDRAMTELPPTMRWMDSIGSQEVNPNDWVWVESSEHPGWRYPIAMEHFNSLGSVDALTMHASELSGSAEYASPYRRGGSVQFMDHLMTFPSRAQRNGCTLAAYKDDLLLHLVHSDHAYLVKEVLTKPKYQAYCRIVDPACPFSQRTACIRVFECLVAAFTDWDPMCQAVQAELDALHIPILNGTYDLPRAFTMIKALVKRIIALDTSTSRNDKVVTQMLYSLGLSSEPLLNEWNVSVSNRFTIAQALGRNPSHYEIFEELIDAMRSNGVRMTTKPQSPKNQYYRQQGSYSSIQQGSYSSTQQGSYDSDQQGAYDDEWDEYDDE